ncbi:hypothetical protein CRG98_020215 [Punica granatum]|uniref:Uncharacterized protein n=1 Tax=Punica granatum TaxID=22663 RepID=A0A2I0JSV9_PUNGR|nr:hypothetical protein CRG98_020215 [Punica granatum]
MARKDEHRRGCRGGKCRHATSGFRAWGRSWVKKETSGPEPDHSTRLVKPESSHPESLLLSSMQLSAAPACIPIEKRPRQIRSIS